jgi:hypothetical protein
VADDLYRFVINAYSPETMPMARLAEYMADLATLVGEKAAVHFVKIDPGSTALAWRTEREAVHKVDDRLRRVSFREGPVEAIVASERIDRMLRDDGGDGYIEQPSGAKLLEFPGVKRLVHTPFAPFWQSGHLNGVVVLVGNKKGKSPARNRATSAVHLEDEARSYNCTARRGIALELKQFLLTDTVVRCFGEGRWERGADGRWTLLEFRIERYQELTKGGLRSIVDEMRRLPGAWKEGPNPLEILRDSKYGSDDDEDEVH